MFGAKTGKKAGGSRTRAVFLDGLLGGLYDSGMLG
jgi:hypothetical protein